jgi:hypothetical protein
MFRGRIYQVYPPIKWRFPKDATAFYVDESDTEGSKIWLNLALTEPLLCQFHKDQQLVLSGFSKDDINCPICLTTEMK